MHTHILHYEYSVFRFVSDTIERHMCLRIGTPLVYFGQNFGPNELCEHSLSQEYRINSLQGFMNDFGAVLSTGVSGTTKLCFGAQTSTKALWLGAHSTHILEATRGVCLDSCTESERRTVSSRSKLFLLL